MRARLHPREFGGADHQLGRRRFRHVQGDDVAAGEQRVQPAGMTRVAERELGLDVVVDDVHAERFGHHPDLGADVAVADDAERLAAHFVAAGGGLGPATTVALRRFLRDAAHQHDRFGDDQFGHAAGIGVGRVEHRDAGALGGGQVDLVGADAERADGDQLAGVGQRVGIQAGARADADDVRLAQFGDEGVGRERLVEAADVAVAGIGEGLGGAVADAFQQQHADVGFGEGSGGHDAGKRAALHRSILR